MVTKKNNGFFFSKLDITLILLYSLLCLILVNLCNRTGEERGWETLYDKRGNNYFVWKNFPPIFKQIFKQIFL